jgi:T4 RnlA family RNA ligase
MLNIQKWLLDNHGDRIKLTAEYGINSSQHRKFPNLYQFTYDQIESSKIKDHPMVRECRGIILDREDNWKVVARPFDRFFNWGETVSGCEFDFSSMVAQEKIDGSLIILYYYRGSWNVATKGSPDAGGSVGKEPFTFEELFWNIFNSDPVYNLDPRNTYLFELTSRYNRVVTNQIDNDGKITLIGIRDNETGSEFWSVLYNDLFSVVKQFDLNTIDDVLTASKELDPSKQEGFVLVDKNFNRIKVKSEKYVLIHHLKDSLNDERLVDLLKTGEDSEVFAYFPDLKARYDVFQTAWNHQINELDACWFNVGNIYFASQKDFAWYIQDSYNSKYHNFFYMMRAGKIKNAKEWFTNLQSKKVVELLCYD